MRGRLDKIIATGFLMSRSEARAAIKAGRVSVDGREENRVDISCDSAAQKIFLDDMPAPVREHIYLMMNKPAGVLTATQDSHCETVIDLLPEKYRNAGLGVAGRLDKDTEGLLLITSDGVLNHKLTSPKSGTDKLYSVEVDAPVTADDIKAFAAGLNLGDFISLPALLQPDTDNAASCLVTITEGKFHQVKRMFEARGKRVKYLKRLKIGTLTLDEGLLAGEWRALFDAEIDDIFDSVGILTNI